MIQPLAVMVWWSKYVKSSKRIFPEGMGTFVFVGVKLGSRLSITVGILVSVAVYPGESVPAVKVKAIACATFV
jgi:hypothetical protein